jgi:hypothetical protein
METDDLRAFSTTQFAALSSNHIAALGTDQIAALTTSEVAAFTTAQMHALSTDQIAAFTTDQIVALESRDIAALSMAQSVAFTTDQIAVMDNGQINSLMGVSPIVLDLDGNGVSTLSAAHGVSYDLTGTGTRSQVGWVGGNDGLLVMDRNGDGQINDGRELFGAATLNEQGHRVGNGYAAMALEDSNHDGVLNHLDANWNKLQVWIDANHDGKTDAGELKSLESLGVTELSLAHTAGSASDHGNLLGLVGSYKTSDGATHDMADVWFAKDAPAAAAGATVHAAAQVSLGDLLAPPQGSVLPADHAATAATATATPAHSTALPLHKLNDDELNKLNPLL